MSPTNGFNCSTVDLGARDVNWRTYL